MHPGPPPPNAHVLIAFLIDIFNDPADFICSARARSCADPLFSYPLRVLQLQGEGGCTYPRTANDTFNLLEGDVCTV